MSLKEDIAEIRTDVRWLRAAQEAHIEAHRKFLLLVCGALIASGLSLVISFQ